MEINKQHLEEKLNLFITQHKQAAEQQEIWSTQVTKLAGAVDTIKILIKELEEEKK